MSTALPLPVEARTGTRPGPSWGRRLHDAIERPLGELELAYRQHFLKSDTDQATIGMAMIVLPMMLIAFSDYLLVGFGNALAVLMLMRVTFLTFSLALIWRLRGTQSPAAFDRAIAIWSVVAILHAFSMNAIRPPDHTLQVGIQALGLMAMYLVIPSLLTTRLTMAVIVTVLTGLMQLSGRREADPATQMLIWTTIMLTNVMGLTISSRFQRLRRQQFIGRLEIERTRDELEAIASTDALTGLLTRRRLLELAEQNFARAQRYGRDLTVIAIDLDHFKQVNDRYGHAAGDVVLIAVANVLSEQTRQQDLVGRIGGEELAVVLPETSLDAARQTAHRIRRQVSTLMPVVDGVAIPVTVSLGVAEARSDDRSIQEPLKRADRALYRAKDRGRDRVEAA